MMRRLVLAAAIANLCCGAAHAQDTREVRQPKLPPACALLFGEVANTGRDDAARIQAAIDQCAPGRAVVLAASNEKRSFVSGPLTLKSGVTLVVDAGVTLYASTDPRLFDRGAGTCGSNDGSGKGCRPLIAAENTRGSGIMGTGTIDGQGGQPIAGKPESWWQIARRAQKEKTRQNVPRLIQVDKSQDFTLYGILLKNSPNFHVTLNGVDGFTAWGVRIDTPHEARNTDGIDPISSRNVTIAHSWIRTGDDNVAIKAGNGGPTEHVSILHNHFYSGHGMSIGSETNGGVRKVLVDDLSMDGTTSGLRIKSNDTRGGTVSGILYHDICMRGVKAPIDISTHYEQAAEPGTLIPSYSEVRMERVRSIGSGPGRVILQGYDEAHPLKLALADVTVEGNAQPMMGHTRLSGTPLNALRTANIECGGKFPAFPSGTVRDPRPQLTAEQAGAYDYREVLKYVGPVGSERVEPWDPLADPLVTQARLPADYVVNPQAPPDGVTRFASVQAAVSRAVLDAGRKRVVIRLAPGTYDELVYVPPASPPLTLIGDGPDPAATRIRAALDASTTGAAYRQRYAAQFEHAAPAVRALYDGLKDLPALGTYGSSTVWVQADGFQARNLTIENAFNREERRDRAVKHAECSGDKCPDTTGGSRVHHQAVALRVDGADRVQFEQVRLLGLQDTLFLSSKDYVNTTRSFFHKTWIEGDVDFIFGDTIAYFQDCEVRQIGGRPASYALAPDTSRRAKYGMVFNGCRFSGDDSPGAKETSFYFARQWFHNQRCTPYGQVPVEGYTCTLGEVDVYKAPNGSIRKRTLEAVGKAVILNSRIGGHIVKTHPWSEWNRQGTLAHRPAQFSSDDWWNNLQQAGFDPATRLGETVRPAPADIYLGEYNNTNE